MFPPFPPTTPDHDHIPQRGGGGSQPLPNETTAKMQHFAGPPAHPTFHREGRRGDDDHGGEGGDRRARNHRYIHTYIHTYKRTNKQTNIHTHIHTYIHIYIHAYIHTDRHTYMHTDMHVRGSQGRRSPAWCGSSLQSAVGGPDAQIAECIVLELGRQSSIGRGAGELHCNSIPSLICSRRAGHHANEMDVQTVFSIRQTKQLASPVLNL